MPCKGEAFCLCVVNNNQALTLGPSDQRYWSSKKFLFNFSFCLVCSSVQFGTIYPHLPDSKSRWGRRDPILLAGWDADLCRQYLLLSQDGRGIWLTRAVVIIFTHARFFVWCVFASTISLATKENRKMKEEKSVLYVVSVIEGIGWKKMGKIWLCFVFSFLDFTGMGESVHHLLWLQLKPTWQSCFTLISFHLATLW